MRVVPSTYHQVITYPTQEGIMEINEDQEKPWSCYNAIIKQVGSK